MGNNDEADITRQDKLADFLEENKDVYAGNERVIAGIKVINDQRIELKAQKTKQSAKTNGITAQTLASFGNLANQTMKLVNIARVWATDKQKVELATLFTFTASSFKAQSKPNAITQAKAVFSALEANAPALLPYEITADDIQLLKDLIAECEGNINASSKAGSNRTTATKAVRTLIKTVNGGYDTLQLLIVNRYKDTNPNFVNGFISNWKKDKRGVRHTGISATITDATTAKPVENATLTIGDTNKTATSNMAGLAEVNKIKPGSYHITISAAGYTTQLVDVTVSRSKVIDLAVALVVA